MPEWVVVWAVLEVYSSIIAAVLHSGTGQNWCSLLTGGQKDGLQQKQIEEECKISWFFPYYSQQQKSFTSLANQHTNQMPKQRGQFLLSRKLIYHYPERLVSFLFTAVESVLVHQRPAWAPRLPGVPAHPRQCSAVESWAARVWELLPVDLEINKRIVGKSCSAFLSLRSEVKGCGLSRLNILAVYMSSRYHNECVSCHHLHFIKGCAALEYPSLFLLLCTETYWFHSTHTCKGCRGPDSHPER